MANGIRYCWSCGKQNVDTTKFCVYCGAKFDVEEPKPVQGQGVPHQRTTQVQNQQAGQNRTQEMIARRAAERQQQAVKPKKSPKKAAKGAIAFVLAIAIFCVTAFGYPGFLRKKDDPNQVATESFGGEQKGQLKSHYKSELVTEGTLTMDNATIEKDGVSVTVEDGFLLKDRDIKVEKITEEVTYSFDGEEEVPLTVYEVDIDGIHEDSMITMEFPMDKNAAPEYRAGYIDEETGEVLPALGEYDPSSGILTVHSTHLTKFCGIPIKNENTAKATLAFVSSYDLYDDETIADYETLMGLFGTTLESGDNIECGMSVLDKLSMIQGGASVANDLAGAPNASAISNLMEGAGTEIYMGGNQGSIGEIMNTNWGKAGAMAGDTGFGKTATKIVGYDETLKTVYPAKVIDKISKSLTTAGRLLCLAKLTNNVIKEGWQSKEAASEAYKWAASEMIGLYVKRSTYTAGLGVYMIGVAAFGLALDYVYNEALNGRKEAYIHAYTKYYAGDGHRTDDQWIAEFKKIMKKGGTFDDLQAEIDSYVNEFWDKEASGHEDYLINVLTDDDRHAWGIETGAGLTPKIKKEISDNYKARLYKKRMPDIFRKLEEENCWEICEKYEAEIETTRKLWNQRISLQITSPMTSSEDDDEEKATFAGCTVRFKDLKNKVNDPKKWECVLNEEGKGTITFTLLAHMIANAGTELEVVKTEDDEEKVVATGTLIFKEEYDRMFAYCEITGEMEEEVLGDYPAVDADMKIENMLGIKQYQEPAQFTLEPDGHFYVSIPSLSIDREDAYGSDLIYSYYDNIRYAPFTMEGDFANGGTSVYKGGDVAITTKDIVMTSPLETDAMLHNIIHPNDENKLYEDFKIHTLFTQIDSLPTPNPDTDNYWFIRVSATRENKLVVNINAVMNRNDHSEDTHDGSVSDDNNTFVAPIIMKCDISPELLEQFQKSFPE